MGKRLGRIVRAAVAFSAVLALAACTGLPTNGDVKQGLALGAAPEEVDILPVASGPMAGAGPAEIVDGFLEAAITPTDNWETAQKFLTSEFAAEWRPTAGVSIDESSATRTFAVANGGVEAGGLDSDAADEESADSSAVAEDVADGSSTEIDVKIELVATIDATGAYSEETGTTTLAFTVLKTDGQWRISQAPDGVVIDENRFPRVYDDYPLQYFDSTWTRLVPDVRWFPRRATIATTITQSLIGGAPSPWLEPAVQSAFPADVRLARDAVPIDPDLVADVALNRQAQGLDDMTLARMRTQLQETLEAAGVHVSQVRFTVDGRVLEAGVVKLVEDASDSGAIVLKDGQFGSLVGGEIGPVGGISDDIIGVPQTIVAADVSVDETKAALTLDDGRVFLAGDGSLNELDARPSLVRPSMDPYGFTWSVPSNSPGAVIAWDEEVTEHPVLEAWPEASEVSAIRVAFDGARIAAVVTIGGERWIVVAAIVRDDQGTPLSLGVTEPLVRLDGTASDLAWLGTDELGVLVDAGGPAVRVQIVGGTGTVESAPAEAASIAGSRSQTGMRVLDAAGSLFARSGASWRETATGISLLATRAGH